jgi:hypothetical protein
MDTATLSLTLRLSDLPLWRLLVALDDTERTVGADSPTARTIAREVQRRLRAEWDCDAGRRATAGREEVVR